MAKIFSRSIMTLALLAVLFIVGKYLYMKPKFINGEVPPNFTGYLANGDSIQLADFRGELILLDFWGSWCGPCRQESPDLRALHQKFHGKKFKDAEGFDIISVGIESKRKSWLKAIESDQLNWKNHVCDFKRLNSDIALQYGVREIPTKFLLNEDGMIIGVNQSFQELDKILSARLAN
ncbi:MAG: TlpA family protein disulfide reductase [Saprospiraceae bacterium]